LPDHRSQSSSALPEPASTASAGYPESSATDDWGVSDKAADDWGAPKGDDWGSTSKKDDDWGAPESDDWGASKTDAWGAAPGADAPVNADAEIESLLQARGTTAAPRTETVKLSKKTDNAAAEPVKDGATLATWRGTREPCLTAMAWPCFALEIWDEPEAQAEAISGDHERELYERYKSGAESKEDDAALGPDTTLPADADMGDDKKGKGVELEAEADELDIDLDEDDAVATGMDSSGNTWFSRFQRRVDRSPKQVVRYSWGGSPLWMSKPPDEMLQNGSGPPPCGLCGAPRCFELQILPSCSHQMSARFPDDAPEVKMEWGTAAVYTCSKDCAAADFCEEFVVVQAAV